MRCFLMRRGGIASVELLEQGSDDSLIQQAKAHFEARSAERFDGFEVWDGTRFVYRYTAATKTGEKADSIPA